MQASANQNQQNVISPPSLLEKRKTVETFVAGGTEIYKRLRGNSADPCNQFKDCSTCLNAPSGLCGWCDTPVVYSSGAPGANCAGFDKEGRQVHPGSATKSIVGNLAMITLAIGVIRKAPLAKSYRKVSLA